MSTPHPVPIIAPASEIFEGSGAARGFKAHRLLYHPTLGVRVIKKKRRALLIRGGGQVNLCLDPKRVYKNTSYHKQTKNQWARDDPAFIVLQAGVCEMWMCVR